MERLRTKLTVLRIELEKLREELVLLKTKDELEPDQEDRITTVGDESEAIVKDLKQQDAFIEPYVSTDDLAEEYGGVRRYHALITRMRTRLERLQRKSLDHGKYNGLIAHQRRRASQATKTGTPKVQRAAAAVSGTQGSEQNYEYAKKTLKERFGRQDMLVQKHLTQLLDLLSVKTLNDVNALRCLHEQWAVEFHKTHVTDKDVLDISTLDAILGSLRLELESRERVHAYATHKLYISRL
ncbi:hypothetical protein HPB52_011269 [Rhipicephalus sanguineus]|uniref:Uncharacterized protein n=1 Tax=Rhipicephalus sanguineus TaxID=34632 RepID=A0A9D4Q690_RHISA|nr:hypothetical protein HPB52_011269 [Rhipicephalus sanguineus]